jgi:short-subunit dehydrogenase
MPDDAVRRALVTGASSGIGAAFARILSERGYEVVLVGRDGGRLASVAGTLQGPSQVLAADLTLESDLSTVEEVLSSPSTSVDLLVNNAAAGWHGPFVEQDPDVLTATVALNATALVRLSRAALPPMIARGTGGLISISSVAGASPAAEMATYAATKAFVNNWSASMVMELRGTGVTVTCVKPGYVRTDFHTRSGEVLDHLPDAEWMTPETVALRALEAHTRGRASVVVLPKLPPWQRVQRAGKIWLIRRVPWLRNVKRALRPAAGSG